MKTRKSTAKSVRRAAQQGVVSPQVAVRLAVLAAQAQEDDLSCEDCQALIDQFAECAARGDDPAALLPLVQRHLGACPGCREECEALLRIITSV